MNVSISLPSELVALIEAKVQAGQYASATEVVQQALHLLEVSEGDEAEDVAELRRAWQEGIDSGDAGPLDFARLRQEAMAELVASRKK